MKKKTPKDGTDVWERVREADTLEARLGEWRNDQA